MIAARQLFVLTASTSLAVFSNPRNAGSANVGFWALGPASEKRRLFELNVVLYQI